MSTTGRIARFAVVARYGDEPARSDASGTDWVKAGVTHSTAQHLLVRDLVQRDDVGRLVLTDQGRAVLNALLGRS
jgi:hypothetical protein